MDRILVLCLVALTGFISHAQSQSVDLEKDRRVADSAALAAQDKAISALKDRLKSPKSQGERVALLLRLGEIQVDRASLIFRISTSRRAGDEATKHAHREAIKTFSELITLAKGTEITPRALLLRAQSYLEAGDKGLSKTDFLRVTRDFPESKEAIPSHMALAEAAMASNAHHEAITHLNAVERAPDSPHFPFALYKLGWAHFNTANIPQAVRYAELTAKFYANSAPSETTSGPNAFQENALLDLPVFYVEGMEQNLESFSVVDGFERIERATSHRSSVSILGKVHLRFAKLLRSRGRSADVSVHAEKVFKAHADRPDTLEVLNSGFEFFHQKRDRERLAKLALPFGELFEQTRDLKPFAENWEKLRGTIIQSAQEVDKQVLKNKNNPEIRPHSEYLSQLVEIFSTISDRKDLRVARLVHNLGETLFATGDFAGARSRYRQALALAPDQEAKHMKFVVELQDKILSASYQALKKEKKIPDSIEVKKLSDATPISARDSLRLENLSLEKELALWVSETLQPKSKASPAFRFEAIRTVYAELGSDAAIGEALKFAESNTKSEHGTASAQLVLDTLIKSERWKEVEEVAFRMSKEQGFNKEFAQASRKLAAQSYFKLISEAQANTRSEEVIDLATTYLGRYGDHADDAPPVRLFRAQSYRRVGDPEAATKDLEKIRGATDIKVSAAAAQLRATLSEEQFKLEQAANEFAALQDAAWTELSEQARARVVSLFWATSNQKAMERAQGSPLCKAIEALCRELGSRMKPTPPTKIVKLTKDREVRDLLKSIRTRSKALKDKKSFEVLELSRLIDTSVEHEWLSSQNDLLRSSISRLYKIDKKGVNFPARLELIREFEKILATIAESAFSRTRVSALAQSALLYSDLVNELDQKPEMLEVAEVKQANDAFRSKARELMEAATKLSLSAQIESSDQVILKGHLAESKLFSEHELTTLATELAAPAKPIRFEISAQTGAQAGNWKNEILKALTQNQLRIAGLLLVEGARAFGDDSPMVRRARALFLVKVGAQAEGLAEDTSIMDTLALAQK